MKNVWIVEITDGYEQARVIGAFESEDSANAYVTNGEKFLSVIRRIPYTYAKRSDIDRIESIMRAFDPEFNYWRDHDSFYFVYDVPILK